ncbi:hypothetical protein OHA98_26760 [Streptomyces sp. NBC_00654]|uniref:DUF6630 family protein n=1 Tax=Streptomyces sp. NBC_00654 TaxID=2975799 RepID=UPI0022501F9A|nr:DUF6630 family protein [Streptomyces sp. NBC_00654]MCX4968292.1 hypothetical protein [Streptomyces sp. NBC_00654]
MSGTDAVRTSLEAIATLLAPARPAVAERTLYAHDDPAGYLRDHADALEDRGIDEPVANLAWIALIDALTENGLLAEFDWKEDPGEIRSLLGRLESRPSVDPWVLFDADEMLLPAFEFLEACGRHYREVGAATAVLDIESDCYPVVIVRAARAQELTALARSAGFTVLSPGA